MKQADSEQSQRNEQLNVGRGKTWVLALTSASAFMAALDSQVVNAALGTIRQSLAIPVETLQWTVNAYNLSFAVLLLTGAALGDRFGRRRMFVSGIAIFVIASALCALAPDAGWLIAGRALQGVGSALLMPLAMALLSTAFPREQRAKALGIFSGLTGLAVVAGPPLGGAITAGLSWHWIFWINVPIGLAIILLSRVRVPESFGPPARLDILGLILASAAAFGVVWGLMLGKSLGWSNPIVATSLIAGCVLTIAFVAVEKRISEPMLPMRLFRERAFSAGVLSSLLFTAAMYGVLFFIAQFFQTAQGFGPLGAGVRMMPWTATLFFFAPIGGRLVGLVGERPLVVGGLLLQALGMGWFALVASPDIAYGALVMPMIIAGVGVSVAMPSSQNVVISSVAPAEVGKASGAYNMFRFLGGAFGIAILVSVFDHIGGFASPHDFSAGFKAAVGGAAVLSAVGAVVAMALPARRKLTVSSPTPA
ncbi:MFS transporter [Roseiarcaceae bacterium H3SJ34-1]|uniref:MFS transporter n=1 Tax=Terripilifer ovatus TaxID=3032367 RepID=UPI003AB91ED3|nr:MFS transporter [Roseiarcaceae bacterium H3SJ34-1]